jgi:D-glucosaminate-6-phosphate ammonia-lyase
MAPSMSKLLGGSRRDLFRQGGWAAVAGTLGGALQRAVAAPAEAAMNLYQAIGVRPVVNARGTFTIISGSQSLPEVKKAMEEASRSYVQMDELMDAVGKRLAEITGAEWGMVSNGCAAAMTHATAACIAGTNPERMQKLPDLTGLKNEVIIPEYSRNVYDHAIRMVGVKIIEVRNKAELEAAFNARTAMCYILAGPGDDGPLGTAVVAEVAKRHNVPLLVDAAAEILTFPNVHLKRGATLVAYSGGKCIRGPQTAGLLLGDKALVQAAWLNSAPHHAFGRSLKVGKEEVMGMLAAVEAWTKRDHEAEWKRWVSWLDTIGARAKQVNGVTTEVRQPEGLSNRTPSLVIKWDGAKLGVTGGEVAKLMLEGEPRIVVGGSSGARPDNMASSLSITPYMMMPGDDKVVADRLHAILSNPPRIANPPVSAAPPAGLAGQWDVEISFSLGTAKHALSIEQEGKRLVGTHRGETLAGDLTGSVNGNDVRFRSSHKIEGTRLGYNFTGSLKGDTLEGTVEMGEYGEAKWKAVRHTYRTPGGVVRPVKNGQSAAE